MEAENQSVWQAPPPPEHIPETPREVPEMSEAATLGNIFFEPGRTFEDLRKKPRFILAGLISIALFTGFAFALSAKYGDAGMRRAIVEIMDKNPQVASMPADQKAQTVEMQMMFSRIGRYLTPVFMAIMLLIGGLIYWLGAKAFGGTGGFLHGLSVWTYSMFPPLVVGVVASLIILFFKSADEIDLATSQRGLAPSNLGFLFGKDTSPVLVTLVSVVDLFAIWGWVLAVIGLRVTNRLSTGSAAAIVFLLALVGVFFRIVGAFFSGNPT
ncbi:MAG: Yip1 family protein [Pyrinomonadaceae bacterium]|nr:Yip1 family protein [Pyrinomonadaceae bacterium]